MPVEEREKSETTMLASAIGVVEYCQQASRNILDHLGQLDLKLGLITRLCVKKKKRAARETKSVPHILVA